MAPVTECDTSHTGHSSSGHPGVSLWSHQAPSGVPLSPLPAPSGVPHGQGLSPLPALL